MSAGVLVCGRRPLEHGAHASVDRPIAHTGMPDEQGKMLVREPGGHLVEIKACREAPGVLGTPAR